MHRVIRAALCAATVGIPLMAFTAFAGPAPDFDGDTVPDVVDNCSTIVNPTQCDADNDGYGNTCDCDLNNSGACDTSDIPPFKTALNNNLPAGDINCTGSTDTSDIPPFKTLLNTPGTPGPSGYGCAGTIPCP